MSAEDDYNDSDRSRIISSSSSEDESFDTSSDMNSHSQETLNRVERNAPSLTTLILDGINFPREYANGQRYFSSRAGDDYCILGDHIGDNTNITTLIYEPHRSAALSARDHAFFDGLIRNSSINELQLIAGYSIDRDAMWRCILEVYQQNNNLTGLHIDSIICHDHLISDTISCCTNLREITLRMCYTNEQVPQMVEAIIGHVSLRILNFHQNNIGNAGCDTIATLLADPNCNLHTLRLNHNNISNEGAIVLVNSLVNNKKLQKLNLNDNPVDLEQPDGSFHNGENNEVVDTISRLLCNTSSVNSIYASNHTLGFLTLDNRWIPREQLRFLFRLNMGTNTKYVAIKKILKYNPNIDMEPLYNWDAEGEWTLKALPYIVAWFERAREFLAEVGSSEVSSDEEETITEYEARRAEARRILVALAAKRKNSVETKKLSALYQFARSMPLMFVPSSRIKAGDKKRKREDDVDA